MAECCGSIRNGINMKNMNVRREKQMQLAAGDIVN
jgi:hypothetical protein